jgi:hypothetical protein
VRAISETSSFRLSMLFIKVTVNLEERIKNKREDVRANVTVASIKLKNIFFSLKEAQQCISCHGDVFFFRFGVVQEPIIVFNKSVNCLLGCRSCCVEVQNVFHVGV